MTPLEAVMRNLLETKGANCTDDRHYEAIHMSCCECPLVLDCRYDNNDNKQKHVNHSRRYKKVLAIAPEILFEELL